jgi:signal transduction histidine kinase
MPENGGQFTPILGGQFAWIFQENDILQKIQKGQSVDHFETTRIKKDGSSIFVSISISPILDSWGNVLGTSKVLRDITELKLYEQKLAKAAIKAQEDERYEIGGELHDNVCQILATSMIYLGMMKKNYLQILTNTLSRYRIIYR